MRSSQLEVAIGITYTDDLCDALLFHLLIFTVDGNKNRTRYWSGRGKWFGS